MRIKQFAFCLILLPCFVPIASGEMRSPTEESKVDATRIGFDEAIDRAVAVSLRHRGAQAKHDVQAAKLRGAYAAMGPRIMAEYNDVRYDEEVTQSFGPNTVIMRGERVRGASVTVYQPLTGLYTLSKRAGAESTQETIQALRADAVASEVAFAAAELYRRAQQATEMLIIANVRITAAESQRQDALALARTGRLPSGELARFDMTLSDAKAEAAKLEAAHANALASLSDMLDLPAGLVLDPVDVGNRQLPSNYEHDAVISEVMHDRIDLKQARLASEAASARRDIAYARFSPTVNGFAKLERSYEGSPGYYPEKTASFGLQVSWELWDNGSRTYAVQEAVSEQHHADLVAQALERQIRLEVSQSLTNLKAAIEARKFAEASMKYADEAYRVASIRFKSGASTTTELLLAEEARDRAKGAVVSARTEVELRWFQLERALGRSRPNQL